MNFRPPWTSWIIPRACILFMLSTLSHADDLLHESFLQLNLSSEQSQQTNASQASMQIIENLQGPFAVYIWDQDCGQCAKDLKTFNQLQSQDKLQGHAIVRLNSEKPNSRSLQAITTSTQLYNPYAHLAKQPAPHYQFLPQVRVYNSQGELAAVYPAFQDNWQAIVRLTQRLKTPEFADYRMPNRDIALYMSEQTENGNILKLKKLPESSAAKPSQTRPDIFTSQVDQDVGAMLLHQRPNHQPSLTQPFASATALITASDDVSTRWRGLSFDAATPILENQRLLVSAQTASASDFENQLMRPNTKSPKAQKFAIGLEGFNANLLYRATLFHQPNEYRKDLGLTVDIEHLLWNDRASLRLSSSHFKASHDEFVTVENAGDDHNRRHKAGISLQLNAESQLAFDWHHDALQGIIENPDELIRFGVPGSTGSQFALYPTTRTQNTYVLQLKQRERSYGVQYFEDTWSREKLSLFTSSHHQFNEWQLANTLSLSHQGEAKFFSNLFPRQNAQTLLSNNAGLAGFDSLVLDLKATTQLGTGSAGFSLWNRPTSLVIGTQLGYFDFESLTKARGSLQDPITNFAIATTIGIEVEL